MDSRISDLGGSLAFRRARLGGVRVEMRIPLPLVPRTPGLVTDLAPPVDPLEA
jgi:hypothetical protein